MAKMVPKHDAVMGGMASIHFTSSDEESFVDHESEIAMTNQRVETHL
jgi:hypothetical protein